MREPYQKTAFQTLEDCSLSALILASPTNESDYILDTDVSLIELGAVLQQRRDKEIRVIEYASRLVSHSGRNYRITQSVNCLQSYSV